MGSLSSVWHVDNLQRRRGEGQGEGQGEGKPSTTEMYYRNLVVTFELLPFKSSVDFPFYVHI